jgi:flavin-dependent dehydrogenase
MEKRNVKEFSEHMKTYQWTVVGAGPAGIAAVGKLLDLGNSPRYHCLGGSAFPSRRFRREVALGF